MDSGLDFVAGKILLVSYGGGHAAALAPVAQELHRRGLPVAILGLTTAADYFHRRGLPAFGMAELVAHVPGYEDAPVAGRRLAAGQPRHAAVPMEETEAYLGVGYTALERMAGPDEAARRYAALGRQSFGPVDFFQRLFRSARPLALVATNSPRSEQAALEAASIEGVPSLCLVDLYAAHEIAWCATEDYADLICVLNETVAQRFRGSGVPDDRIVVTGNPAFDRLGQLDVFGVRSRHRDALGFSDEDRLVVWISQPEAAVHPFSGNPGDPALPTIIERELAAAFSDDLHIHLVMRLHPSEDRPPAVSGRRLRYGNAQEPLDDLLCAADCVVTCSSTVGLEAALLGISVVQVMRSIFSADLPLARMGLATAAETADETTLRVREAIAGPRGERPTGRPFGAAERVADRIASLLPQAAS